MWLGSAEYLFRKPKLLDEAIDAAIDDVRFRGDDTEFVIAARVGVSVVFQNFTG